MFLFLHGDLRNNREVTDDNTRTSTHTVEINTKKLRWKPHVLQAGVWMNRLLESAGSLKEARVTSR